MDLVALRIFKEVAEQGGVTRAAARLHRVQSNVTTRVKQLEDALATRLFERNGRGLALTPAGQVLLGYANRLLELSSEARAALKTDAPRGVFRLGTLESTAAARLPPVLCAYHREFPDVDIELCTGTSGALIRKVFERELEAAFVSEPFDAAGLQTTPVFIEDLVLVSAQDAAPIRRPRDIGRTTVIAFPSGCSYRRRLEAWLGRGAAVPERVLEVGSYHAIVACVAAGIGIAIVPRSVLALAGPDPGVRIHRLPTQVARSRTHLVWRAGHLSPALGALRSLVTRAPPAAQRPSSARRVARGNASRRG